GVLVELDVAAVRAALLLDGADDDGLDDLTLLHTGGGDGVLDGGDDDVADGRVAAPAAAEDTDAEDLLGTGVVGDAQSRFLLDHRFCPGPLLGLLDDGHETPALRRRERAGLHDEHAV